jgi:hypothetical protein
VERKMSIDVALALSSTNAEEAREMEFIPHLSLTCSLDCQRG